MKKENLKLAQEQFLKGDKEAAKKICLNLIHQKSDTNVFEATVKEIEFLGSYQRVYLEAIGVTENLVIVDLPNSSEQKINLVLNNKLNISFPMDNIRVYPN